MDTAAFSVTLITIIVLLIVIISSFIYVIPIIFVRRFHTGANVLLVGLSVNGIICSILWVVWNSISIINPTLLVKSKEICIAMNYLSTLVNSLIIYCLVVITINQFFAVIYPKKKLFHTVKCAIFSITVQWIVSIIVSIPDVVISVPVCVNGVDAPRWLYIYRFVTILVFPSILKIVLNASIFCFVRSSTRRVKPKENAKGLSNASPKWKKTRDTQLLKHMIFLYVVFIFGWGPIYLLPIAASFTTVSPLVLAIFQLLPVVSSFTIVLDLFYYNRDLIRYFKEQCLKCF
ncbi:unnamed protein product [Adineta ricciae]|uniref:G-protein coupled receptors family 1 profile domain-containing protein n=1 Tax=Adineta ricciae TaxID=249248 RepID=A0A813S729_ADIRI|nr:unnamed protein product [Adineta ricciae]